MKMITLTFLLTFVSAECWSQSSIAPQEEINQERNRLANECESRVAKKGTWVWKDDKCINLEGEDFQIFKCESRVHKIGRSVWENGQCVVKDDVEDMQRVNNQERNRLANECENRVAKKGTWVWKDDKCINLEGEDFLRYKCESRVHKIGTSVWENGQCVVKDGVGDKQRVNELSDCTIDSQKITISCPDGEFKRVSSISESMEKVLEKQKNQAGKDLKSKKQGNQ